MIGTLDQAFDWYMAAKIMSKSMGRMGLKHWDTLTREGMLSADDQLRLLKSENIVQQAKVVLDDLCVLLLFSVFEAIVRDRVLREVSSQLPPLRHPSIMRAIDAMKTEIEQGSFGRVMEPYKTLDPTLVEEVNQVRRYRNWVAHGRRDGEQPASVDPKKAHERLRRFLVLLAITESHSGSLS